MHLIINEGGLRNRRGAECGFRRNIGGCTDADSEGKGRQQGASRLVHKMCLPYVTRSDKWVRSRVICQLAESISLSSFP
jgi:hypothetical protein